MSLTSHILNQWFMICLSILFQRIFILYIYFNFTFYSIFSLVTTFYHVSYFLHAPNNRAWNKHLCLSEYIYFYVWTVQWYSNQSPCFRCRKKLAFFFVRLIIFVFFFFHSELIIHQFQLSNLIIIYNKGISF